MEIVGFFCMIIYEHRFLALLIAIGLAGLAFYGDRIQPDRKIVNASLFLPSALWLYYFIMWSPPGPGERSMIPGVLVTMIWLIGTGLFLLFWWGGVTARRRRQMKGRRGWETDEEELKDKI